MTQAELARAAVVPVASVMDFEAECWRFDSPISMPSNTPWNGPVLSSSTEITPE
jgi:hypothetical protein